MTYQQDVGIVKVKSMLSGEKCDILTYIYSNQNQWYIFETVTDTVISLLIQISVYVR